MSKGLTLEQMEFLLSKGLSGEDMVTFAKLGNAKSKGAERVARWRANQRAKVADGNAESVTCNVTSNALPPPIEDHTPPVSPIGENRAVRKKAIPAAKPEDVPPEVWSDWMDHRKRKGGTCTETAISGIRSEAEKAGWTLEAALRKAMQRNWQGFEASWVETKPNADSPPGKSVATAFMARHGQPA